MQHCIAFTKFWPHNDWKQQHNSAENRKNGGEILVIVFDIVHQNLATWKLALLSVKVFKQIRIYIADWHHDGKFLAYLNRKGESLTYDFIYSISPIQKVKYNKL